MTKSEENQERLGDLSDHYVGLTLVKESGKEGSLSGRILGSRVDLRKFSKANGRDLPARVAHQRTPSSPRYKPALVSPMCSGLGWEQPMGCMASALTPGWISQPSIWDFSQ